MTGKNVREVIAGILVVFLLVVTIVPSLNGKNNEFDLTASNIDAYAVAGAMVMETQANPLDDNVEPEKVECDGSGWIYPDGASRTKCPGCDRCKDSGQAPEEDSGSLPPEENTEEAPPFEEDLGEEVSPIEFVEVDESLKLDDPVKVDESVESTEDTRILINGTAYDPVTNTKLGEAFVQIKITSMPAGTEDVVSQPPPEEEDLADKCMCSVTGKCECEEGTCKCPNCADKKTEEVKEQPVVAECKCHLTGKCECEQGFCECEQCANCSKKVSKVINQQPPTENETVVKEVVDAEEYLTSGPNRVVLLSRNNCPPCKASKDAVIPFVERMGFKAGAGQENHLDIINREDRNELYNKVFEYLDKRGRISQKSVPTWVRIFNGKIDAVAVGSMNVNSFYSFADTLSEEARATK